MRQTAVKAVPFAKSGAKPQPESENFKKKQKHRETPGENPGCHQVQSPVYYHSEVRTPIATAMFGEKKAIYVLGPLNSLAQALCPHSWISSAWTPSGKHTGALAPGF